MLNKTTSVRISGVLWTALMHTWTFLPVQSAMVSVCHEHEIFDSVVGNNTVNVVNDFVIPESYWEPSTQGPTDGAGHNQDVLGYVPMSIRIRMLPVKNFDIATLTFTSSSLPALWMRLETKNRYKIGNGATCLTKHCANLRSSEALFAIEFPQASGCNP